MMYFIDTHAHIFDSALAADLESVLLRAQAAQVGAIYMPNLNEKTLAPMLDLEQSTVVKCFACVGLHPCYIEVDTYKDQLLAMEHLLGQRSFAAIGETGLDAYHRTDNLPLQEEVLAVHLDWAKRYKRPVILHARNTLPRLLEVIKSYGGNVRGVFHCFTGDYKQATQAIDLGFNLGVGGVVTYKNGKELRQVLSETPHEAWVLETDSPYLMPTGAPSKPNEPAYLPLIAKQVARAWKKSIEEVAALTTLNAQRLFEPFYPN